MQKSTKRYLMVSSCLLALLAYSSVATIFNFEEDFSWFVLACILASLLYPFVSQIVRAGTSFLKGLLTLLGAMGIAIIFSEVVYYLKMNPIHHDEGEAIGIWFIYVAGAVIAALILYPIGFWGTRILRRILP